MNVDNLIVDLDDIPLEVEGIAQNLDLMIEHASFLESIPDIKDPRAEGILSVAPSYIKKQLHRLRSHLDDEVDIIAWLSRTLMELLFMLRFMYSGKEQYDELIREQLKDLRDLEAILYPDGSPDDAALDEVKQFHRDMQNLWEEMEEYEISPDSLKGHYPAYYFAKGSGLEHEYKRGWKIHSKYVHPTSFLLFGNPEFVYHDETRKYFWALAQYYAARNLRDLHKMLEAMP